MTEPRMVLPAGLRDEMGEIFLDLLEERIDALDVSVVLVYLLEHVDASALPALGWQFDIPVEAWAAADTAGRRVIVQEALEKQRRRGTIGSVRRALLESLEIFSHVFKNPALYADGSARADGTFHADAGGVPLTFWLVLLGEDSAVNQAQVALIVDEWKRKAAHLEHIYFAPSEATVADPSEFWSNTTEGLLTTEGGDLLLTEGGAPLAV